MKIKFIKMQALGNDFIIIDQRKNDFEISVENIKNMAHRRLGIGCDQFIIIKPHLVYDCVMNIYNQDGSEALACGNATRCVALLLNKEESQILVGNRLLRAKIKERDISVNMGVPILEKEILIPNSNLNPALYVNIGNEHLVFIVRDLKSIALEELAIAVRKDSRFQNGINISIANVVSYEKVEIRVWERGVGETPACGSAACAVFAAAKEIGLLGKVADIELAGGKIFCLEKQDGSIEMNGEARLVFEGEYFIS